jgi:hypothetical protein
MSKRARAFVEYWLSEFLHPDAYEDEDELCESRNNAAQCLRAAAARGIPEPEIREEFGDLVGHIAALHERIVEAGLSAPDGLPPPGRQQP